MMFDNHMDGHELRSVSAGIADRERQKTSAMTPHRAHLAGKRPNKAAWWKGTEATAFFPMRIERSFAMHRKPSLPAGHSVKLLPQGIDQWVCSIAILGLLLSTACGSLSGASGGAPPTHLSALELVKDVVRNEKKAREHPRNYYKFVQEETTPKGSKTSIRIETAHGEIGKTISVNGKPPSQTQCRKDASSLKQLSKDSEFQQRQSREQKEENARIDQLMAAVPRAFIFRFKGKQQGAKQLEITFRPNARFQPQSRETALLKGMQGALWVDTKSRRLVKIEGTLINSVNFGWGFLASVHRGGRFALQQTKVAGGSWKATFLKVDLDGSKLVFGQLHVHFKDRSYSFVPLASPPSLADAVNMLEHSATACRESKGQSATAQAQIN